ncbi:MAG: outer membrane lipoprotein-sorting protein [Thermodesulfobacteriota bacterium]|nr:outer membrane lipoprotein-sorting protein [Thermodesulfobacteriota bacterium]
MSLTQKSGKIAIYGWALVIHAKGDIMLLHFFRHNHRRSGGLLFMGAIVCLLSLSFLAAAPVCAEKSKARLIMEKVDALDDGDNMVADMKMILIDKNQNTRERIMRTFAKDKGEDTLQLIFFTAPPAVKDTGFLTYDYDNTDKDDDQWLYLPALKKTKRIAAGDKTDAFMGSDFSYADMTSRVIDNYTYKLLKEDKVNGKKVWLIEAVPVNQDVIDTFGYTKSVAFIRQDNYYIVRAVSWVADSDKLKYLDVRELEKIDGIWVAKETHMTTKRGGETQHKTILIQDNIKFNQDLDESMFTVRRLEKGL